MCKHRIEILVEGFSISTPTELCGPPYGTLAGIEFDLVLWQKWLQKRFGLTLSLWVTALEKSSQEKGRLKLTSVFTLRYLKSEITNRDCYCFCCCCHKLTSISIAWVSLRRGWGRWSSLTRVWWGHFLLNSKKQQIFIVKCPNFDRFFNVYPYLLKP